MLKESRFGMSLSPPEPPIKWTDESEFPVTLDNIRRGRCLPSADTPGFVEPLCVWTEVKAAKPDPDSTAKDDKVKKKAPPPPAFPPYAARAVEEAGGSDEARPEDLDHKTQKRQWSEMEPAELSLLSFVELLREKIREDGEPRLNPDEKVVFMDRAIVRGVPAPPARGGRGGMMSLGRGRGGRGGIGGRSGGGGGFGGGRGRWVGRKFPFLRLTEGMEMPSLSLRRVFA